jgi:hypothetical protein
MDDEFEVLEGEGSEDGGAAGEEGRIGSEGSLGEEDDGGGIGADSSGDLFCCGMGSEEGGLPAPTADTVFCDGFFDFFALSTGEEQCNCRTATTLGRTRLDRNIENTTLLIHFV